MCLGGGGGGGGRGVELVTGDQAWIRPLPHHMHAHDTHCIVVQGASSLPMHVVFNTDCGEQMAGNCLTRLECCKKSSLVAVLHFKVLHKQTLPSSHDQLW